MSGGGGGGGLPPQDNSVQVEMMRQQAAREAQARVDSQKAQDKLDFQGKLSTAVSGAKNTGTNYLNQRGLANDKYGSVIDSIIGNTKLKVPELDSNPGSYFTDDTFASGLDNYQTMQRNNNTSKVNTAFAPGFDKSLLSDNADDDILNNILGTQRAGAEQQLDFNRKRGILNDSGYNTAFGDLGRQNSAGMATLTGIGDSVLGKGRQTLNDIRGEAGTAGSSYALGMPDFDVNPYSQRATEKANTLKSGLDGNIRSALGSTNLFDVAGAIAKGGTAQGPINLTTVDTAQGVPFAQKKSQTGRGLNSSGAF